jgi:two-component system sensor kinase FixL
MLGLRATGQLTRDFDRSIPHAVVDAIQIQQVVVNLLRNAFEAVRSQPHPQVTVRTRHEGEWLTVSVEDNGPGLDPAMVPQLFKAFSTSKRTGMGLGLSISRTIAQNHAGDLTVDPGGKGRGARFTLHLPVVDPDQGSAEGDDDDR